MFNKIAVQIINVTTQKNNHIIMPKPYFKCFRKNCKSNRGFTLVEVLVVMVIVGILATGVVFMFADPTAKVKAAAFEMRGDFNLARAVAVKENADVLISFDDGTNDGYRICFDTDGNSDCYNESGEDIIKDVVFRDRVTFYNFTSAPFPADGPDKAPAIDGVEKALTGLNGITLGAVNGGGYPYINFTSNGTCEPPDKQGVAIVYLSEQGNLSIIKGRPYAVVVDNMNTGRVRLERWRPEKDDWDRK
jgi:prepilin-type N-terminal cleavage/methylation domain-containing protein